MTPSPPSGFDGPVVDNPCSFHSVAILSTPKTGNLWLRFVLERALHMISVSATTDPEIQVLLDSQAHQRSSCSFLFHAHIMSTNARRQAFAKAGMNLVTILRHPIDIFISQLGHARRIETQSWPENLLLNDATVEEYLNYIFPAVLAISASWARAGVPILRYEEMIRIPRTAYQSLLENWLPNRDHTARVLFMTRIGTIDMLRQTAQSIDKGHFAVGRAGQWRQEENRDIVRMFQRNRALTQTIEDWGYSANPSEFLDECVSPNDASSSSRDPLQNIDLFDNGVRFAAHLKVIFHFHDCNDTGDFDHARPAATDAESFFAWLTRPHDDAIGGLTNLEFETLRFRIDVVKAFTCSHGLETDSYRHWLHVHGAREHNIPHCLLEKTAVTMGRLK
jgi:hypothetical protein